MAGHQVAAGDPLYQCKSCERHLGVEAFYTSNQSKCKECVRAGVRRNREAKAEYYRSYDRMRYREDPDRKAHCIAAGKKTPMSVRVEKQRQRRRDDPSKNKARRAVARAVAKGQITRVAECFFCASSDHIQAHHHDYSKPLDVFWLCASCHGKLHTINGDFHRAGTAGV